MWMMMVSYDLIRSKRKTISMQVTDELRVLVRAPNRMPLREIEHFIDKNTDWIETQSKKRSAYLKAHPQLSEAEIETLKRRAKDYIPGRVDYFSGVMGLYPIGVKITSAKTRFGSCSGKNSLCFSCRLMGYPLDAIDYVVVHELAHIRHKNHGRDFYALIESVLPDYKMRQKLLKK